MPCLTTTLYQHPIHEENDPLANSSRSKRHNLQQTELDPPGAHEAVPSLTRKHVADTRREAPSDRGESVSGDDGLENAESGNGPEEEEGLKPKQDVGNLDDMQHFQEKGGFFELMENYWTRDDVQTEEAFLQQAREISSAVSSRRGSIVKWLRCRSSRASRSPPSVGSSVSTRTRSRWHSRRPQASPNFISSRRCNSCSLPGRSSATPAATILCPLTFSPSSHWLRPSAEPSAPRVASASSEYCSWAWCSAPSFSTLHSRHPPTSGAP